MHYEIEQAGDGQEHRPTSATHAEPVAGTWSTCSIATLCRRR